MLTILCPVTSRGCSTDRAEQPILHALLPSLDAHEMWGSTHLFVGYDEDDPLWSRPEVREGIRRPIRWVAVKNHQRNLTAVWRQLERAARPWEYLLPANDDLQLITSPLPAMERLRARGNFGLVGFDDAAFPGLATFFVIHKTHLRVFGELYPLPWAGAHQDSWIADVYRPWRASEIDPRIKVHNRMGSQHSPVTQPRFEYGRPDDYREHVLAGRRKLNEWLRMWPSIAPTLPDFVIEGTTMVKGL